MKTKASHLQSHGFKSIPPIMLIRGIGKNTPTTMTTSATAKVAEAMIDRETDPQIAFMLAALERLARMEEG